MVVKGRAHTEEYTPGTLFNALVWISVVAIVTVGILVSFTSEFVESSGSSWWIWFAGTLAAALAGPPLLQYLALRTSDARLTRKPWIANNRVPYLFRWWNPEGRGLNRLQFVVAMGAPALLFWIIVVPFAITNPIAAGAIGIGLANFVGNFLYSALVLTKPPGTLIEEFDGGLRFHVPPT